MRKVSKAKIIEVINYTVEGFNISYEQENVDLSVLGMDSIAFIHTVVALEEEFECEIPDEKLMLSEMNTVKKIYDVLINLVEMNSKCGET